MSNLFDKLMPFLNPKRKGIPMKKVFGCAALFFSVLAISVVFLTLGLFLPQTPIHEHTVVSSELLMQEGTYPKIGDGAPSATLDNFTDAHILAESHAMSSADWKTIFSNPRYKLEDPAATTVDELYAYVHGEITESTGNYIRYWMGFRTIIRLLLVFLNYGQIRRYLALAFFTLLTAVACSLGKRIGIKAAFLFVLSILCMRPYVIVLNLQYSCCFLIAMTAMLLVPRMCAHPDKDIYYFLVLGMATMFFDFYSTPIITFGLPFLYLYMLRRKNHQSHTVDIFSTCKCAAAWFIGYVGMWISKLLITSVFTDIHGLQNGFTSASGWLRNRQSYNGPIDAIQAVFRALYVDEAGACIVAAALIVILAIWIYQLVRRGIKPGRLLEQKVPLVLAALPLIWFAIASKPTVHHFGFQYRSIVLTIWAMAMYLTMTLEENPQ